jgi:hypothetical protein
MHYEIEVAVARTGVTFMYHTTRDHEEALRLLKKYRKFDGVEVKLNRKEN